VCLAAGNRSRSQAVRELVGRKVGGFILRPIALPPVGRDREALALSLAPDLACTDADVNRTGQGAPEAGLQDPLNLAPRIGTGL
jgi:hypothetical protein